MNTMRCKQVERVSSYCNFKYFDNFFFSSHATVHLNIPSGITLVSFFSCLNINTKWNRQRPVFFWLNRHIRTHNWWSVFSLWNYFKRSRSRTPTLISEENLSIVLSFSFLFFSNKNGTQVDGLGRYTHKLLS